MAFLFGEMWQLCSVKWSTGHAKAMDKAVAEYRKFQVKELSPVERAYLESIQSVSRIAKRKAREGGSSIKGA